MGLTYKSHNDGYVFWRESIFLPYIDEDGERKFFKKSISFDETDVYWEYTPEEHGWSLYYVKRGINRRLARCGMPKYDPKGIIGMLEDKEITAHDCRLVEEAKKRPIEKRTLTTINWSVEWDGKPALLLVAEKPKMSYKEILQVIQNEGGYVDPNGIIRKGTAVNKVVEID